MEEPLKVREAQKRGHRCFLSWLIQGSGRFLYRVLGAWSFKYSV